MVTTEVLGDLAIHAPRVRPERTVDERYRTQKHVANGSFDTGAFFACGRTGVAQVPAIGAIEVQRRPRGDAERLAIDHHFEALDARADSRGQSKPPHVFGGHLHGRGRASYDVEFGLGAVTLELH